MRFAWLRKNSANDASDKQASIRRFSFIRMIYNIAFWVFLLPFFTSMAYSTGFITFTIIIFIRLGANLYVNFLKFEPEQFEKFPLRIA